MFFIRYRSICDAFNFHTCVMHLTSTCSIWMCLRSNGWTNHSITQFENVIQVIRNPVTELTKTWRSRIALTQCRQVFAIVKSTLSFCRISQVNFALESQAVATTFVVWPQNHDFATVSVWNPVVYVSYGTDTSFAAFKVQTI